jgi:predicted kinase
MRLKDLNRQIILVSGNLCSGKGHFCQSQYPEYTPISVSDIVKSLAQTDTRSELTKTKSLDALIADKLIDEISKHSKVIVDGIRQVSIIKTLQQHFGSQIKDMIWLDVPTDTLRQRFEQRKRSQDDLSFDAALAADNELGVGEVEHYLKSSGKVIKY